MSERIKSQGNEDKNPSGAQSLSPLPAQIEGLATARPWNKPVRLSLPEWIALTTALETSPDISAETLAQKAARLVENRKDFAREVHDNKAKIEALTAALREIRLRCSNGSRIGDICDAALIESPTEQAEPFGHCDTCGAILTANAICPISKAHLTAIG